MNKKLLVSIFGLLLVASIIGVSAQAIMDHRNANAQKLADARTAYLNSGVEITPELMDFLVASSDAIAELNMKDSWTAQKKKYYCNAGISYVPIEVPTKEELPYCGDGICDWDGSYTLDNGYDRQTISEGKVASLHTQDSETIVLWINSDSAEVVEGDSLVLDGILVSIETINIWEDSGFYEGSITFKVGENAGTCNQDCIQQ